MSKTEKKFMDFIWLYFFKSNPGNSFENLHMVPFSHIGNFMTALQKLQCRAILYFWAWYKYW